MSMSLEMYTQVQSHLNSCFDNEHLDHLARKTGFIQRKSNRLIAKDFVQLMSLELLSEPEASLEELCEILTEISPSVHLSPQALSERINNESCVDFLISVFEEALEFRSKEALSHYDSELLEPFSRILTEDSSKIELNEKLSSFFKGCGGAASPSAIKINVVEDIKKGHVEKLDLLEGHQSDQSLLEGIFSILQADDLLLRDLGYFAVRSLKRIQESEAFYLSRLYNKVNVYLSADAQAIPVNLAKYLKEQALNQSMKDMIVFIGKERLKVRLVAYRLREDVANQRKRIAKRNASKKGKLPQKEYLDWLEFSFYITNVPEAIWETQVIGTLYRLRWQVELTFKRWKSLLKIDYIKGTRPERVKALIYGKLIGIIFIQSLYHYFAHFTWAHQKQELSHHKLTNWLIKRRRFAKALAHQTMERLIHQFIETGNKLSKKRRKRRTTWQQVMEKTHFLDTFREEYPLRGLK